MKEEISKIIKEHLPETVAGEMKQFIAKAEENEKELEILREIADTGKKNLAAYVETAAILRKEVLDLKDQIRICEDCKTRYTELIYKEKELATMSLCADMRIYDMKELVSLVFKSPVYRKSVTSNKGIAVDGGRDSCGYINDHTEREETEETEDWTNKPFSS